MSDLRVIILGRLVIAVCATIGASVLAYHNMEGWGWLIFLAILSGLMSGTHD